MKRFLLIPALLALAASRVSAAPVCTDNGTQIVCTAVFNQALGDVLPLTINFAAFNTLKRPGYSLQSVTGAIDATINGTFKVRNTGTKTGRFSLNASADVYLSTGSTQLSSAQPIYNGSVLVPNDSVYHQYTGSASASDPGTTYTRGVGPGIPAMYYGPGPIPYVVSADAISGVIGPTPYNYDASTSTSGTASLVYNYLLIPTPEPASLALIGTGLLGVGLLLRRKMAR